MSLGFAYLGLPVSSGSGLTSGTVNRFPDPATSNVACGFPALRSPVNFTPKLMGPILLEQLSLGPPNPVVVKQMQDFVQSSPTPPYPAEARAVLGSHHMAPDLLLYPVANEAEALAGISDRKVVHPSAQHRVDQFYNSAHWL